MKYLTVIHKSVYGYDISVPALPGCHSQGETEPEALQNIQDAIATYLQMGLVEYHDITTKEVYVPA